jgi:hypothetical protein
MWARPFPANFNFQLSVVLSEPAMVCIGKSTLEMLISGSKAVRSMYLLRTPADDRRRKGKTENSRKPHGANLGYIKQGRIGSQGGGSKSKSCLSLHAQLNLSCIWLSLVT